MASHTISLVLLRALLWGLALRFLLFPGTADKATLLGGLSGAILGGVLGILFESKKITRWYYLAGFSIAGFTLLGGVEVWRDLSAFFGPKGAQTVSACLGTAGLVFGMEVLRRLAMPVRAIQSLLFVSACAQAAWPHRHGHLERPYWLVERLAEWGLSPESFWKLAAMFLLLGALIILRDAPTRGGRLSIKRSAVGSACILLLFGGLWVAVPQPPARPASEPAPPHAPDAPPPPEKLAVVRFSDFCKPTDYTDYAYLFYQKPVDDLINPAVPPAAEVGAVALTPLKTRVLLFTKDAPVPALIGVTGATALTAIDLTRFQSGWEVAIRFPRDSAGGPCYLQMPADRELTKIEATLWHGIFGDDQIRAPKAAARIKEELEKAGKLSEKNAIPMEKWSLEQFVFENTTGGSLNFAAAAAELLRAAGVESRVVSGLRYDPGKDGAFHFKEAIVLTEAHSACWVEWRVPDGEWHPLAVHPKTVLDDVPPPQPEEDLENLLANETPPKTSAAFKVEVEDRTGLGAAALGFIAALAIVSLMALGADLAFAREPEAVVFGWMRGVLECAGSRFDPWQGWEAFERRLSMARPAMARHFGEVRRSVENIRWELGKERLSRARLFWRFLLFLLGFFQRKKSPVPPSSNLK